MNKQTTIPILQGMAVTAGFLLTEIILNFFGAFNGNVQLYLVDVPLRLLFGTIALFLIADNFKKQRSRHSLKQLFTNPIPKSTYLLLLPFALYLLLTLLTMVTAEAFSGRAAGLFCLNAVQQLATGYYEEAALRSLLMCGLLAFYTNTAGQRIRTVLIAGICFGLSHMLNFFFGNDIFSTLWQSFSCAFWGFFIAAIYLLCENLTLIMILHAVWDIIVRVPNAFCGLPESSGFLVCIEVLQYILQFGVMTAAAVYICLHYDKLKRLE